MNMQDASKLRTFDPVYNTVTKTRMRFVRIIDSSFVELSDNNGVVLPDYWHVSQIEKI